mgnify:CR=1 FL=1
MNNLKVFVDFDETLFNHYSYLDWAEEFLGRFGINPGAYNKTVDSFHEHKGENLRLYKHEDHIFAATGKQWSYISGEFEKELFTHNHDFCYADTHAFLDQITASSYDVRLLTYGSGEYQRYKINTCKKLTNLRIPVHVVSQPKRVFLEKNFSDGPGILIDDKYPLHLPSGWVHVWISRKDELSKPEFIKETNTIKVSNLQQWDEALKLYSAECS